MSNPQSPEPARWILEMLAPDIPAWNRAFIQLERKPLDALDDMLVHSFERYLRRKGYLTERQVKVLQGIAKKHNVPLPPIPPIAHRTESSSNFPIEKYPEKEKQRLIGWIESEGSFFAALAREDMIHDYLLPREERVYKWNYLRPQFGFTSTDLAYTQKIQRAFTASRVIEKPPRPPRKREYLTLATGLKALGIAEWIQPELTPNTRMQGQVEATLKVFTRQKPIITLTAQQASAILPIRKEERWQTLLEWKNKRQI